MITKKIPAISLFAILVMILLTGCSGKKNTETEPVTSSVEETIPVVKEVLSDETEPVHSEKTEIETETEEDYFIYDYDDEWDDNDYNEWLSNAGEKMTIDLNDYLEIFVMGYNGHASLSYSMAAFQAIRDLPEKLEYTEGLISDAKDIADDVRDDYLVKLITDPKTVYDITNLPIMYSFSTAEHYVPNRNKIKDEVLNSSSIMSETMIDTIIDEMIEDPEDSMVPADSFLQSYLLMGLSFEPIKNLSNGDIVTVKVNNAKLISRYMNCKFENSPFEYTIEDLRNMDSDIFDKNGDVIIDFSNYITIEISGENGNGKASKNFDETEFRSDMSGIIEYSDALIEEAKKITDKERDDYLGSYFSDDSYDTVNYHPLK